MRKNFRLLCSVVLLAGSVYSWAQEKSISGKVTDSLGFPVSEAYVYVDGTDNGVYTDANGFYSLEVNQGDVIKVEFIGLETKEIKINGGNKYDVELSKEKVIELAKVVALGYTSVSADEYTGTADKVDMASIESKNISNVAQALAGESAGVRVINTSGQPGSNPKIRIRGLGSVNGNRDPLFVVDGQPFFGNISVINPEDIENTTVLKDAAATAIYGSRGANGVIVINTKRGKTNSDFIQIESKVGVNTKFLPKYDYITSPEEYISLAWRAVYNEGVLANEADPVAYANANLFSDKGISPSYNLWKATVAELIDPKTGEVRASVARKYNPENWEDFMFKPAFRTEHNLSMGGGNAKSNYYASIGYLNDGGYAINSNFERYTGRLNTGYKPKDWLTGSFNLGYAYTISRNNGETDTSRSIFSWAQNIPSIYPLYLRDDKGGFVPDPHFGGNQFDYGKAGRGFAPLTNTVADAVYNIDDFNKHEINGAFSLNIDLTKDLSFETRIGGQYYNESNKVLRNQFYGDSAESGGSISKGKEEVFTWNFLQMLKYDKRFAEHGINAFIAHEANSWDLDYFFGERKDIINPKIIVLNNAIKGSAPTSFTRAYSIESYFGQFNYDYKRKYILSASIRKDGTSRFLKGRRWDTFPSVGLGWTISKEEFLQHSEIVNNLKLKVSYGLIGDQAGVDYYPGYNVYKAGNFMGLIGTPFDKNGYPDLTWEKSKMFQTGVEFSLLNDRVEGGVDYYRKLTDQLIFDKRLAPSTGNAIYKDNDGNLLNEGLEFNLTGHIVRSNDWFVDLSINGEVMRNVLTKMPFDNSTNSRKIIDIDRNYGRAEGYSIFDFYLPEWVGVNTKTGAAQWKVNYEDKNDNNKFDEGESIASLHEFMAQNPKAKIKEAITEKYTEATKKFIGKKAMPDVRGGANLKVGYKGFSIGAQMLYSIGGYAYDGTYADLMNNGKIGANNWHQDINNAWKKAGDVTDVPRIDNGAGFNYNSASTRFLVRADYFILNNVNLGYTIPKDYLRNTGFSEFSFTLAADNLWIESARRGFNPSITETGGSFSYTYSPLTNFTLGVKAKF